MTFAGSRLNIKAKNVAERTVGKQLQAIPVTIVISLILFGAIGWRLGYLQLQQGDLNQQKAEDNRTRIIPKPTVRGSILDRQGKILATNRLSYSAYLWPKAQKQKNWLEIRNLIAQILKIDPQDLQKRAEQVGYNYN
ncbi:MAG: penicillin-binding protein 2, partial [Waterburya sp.]